MATGIQSQDNWDVSWLEAHAHHTAFEYRDPDEDPIVIQWVQFLIPAVDGETSGEGKSRYVPHHAHHVLRR